jgi:hypothetical protein
MTTTNPTDPNQVRLTGENSFIRLSMSESGPNTTRVSHWRILLSPAGQGHVLFIQSDAIDDEVQVYSDNIALARWLQEEIESQLFAPFADQSLPVIEAAFSKSGDGRSFWTETIESDEDIISLTWYDFIEPFVLRVPTNNAPGRLHGVYSCFVPARKAQVTVSGRVAQGQPFPQMRGDKASSTACLAWSETWVRP